MFLNFAADMANLQMRDHAIQKHWNDLADFKKAPKPETVKLIKNPMERFSEPWIVDIIDNDIKKHELLNPDIAEKAREFLKKIKCIKCWDTGYFLKPKDGWLYGFYYDEYTCGKCTYLCLEIWVNRFYNHTEAFTSTGRQIPCNTNDERVRYSHALSLAKNYEREFAKEIKLKEVEREKERKKRDEEEKFSGHDFQNLKVEKKSVDVKVDFGELFSQITSIVSMCAGNVAALPLFLKKVDLSLKSCWSKSSNNQNSSEFLKNDDGETVYIRLDYEMRTESNNANVGLFKFGFSSKKEYLNVTVLVLKPVNEAAEEKCRKIMREDFHRILAKLENDKKTK